MYAKYRPSYPVELVEAIVADASSMTGSAQRVVADIGSGTGILAGLLLDRGCTVYAVEPNEAMRLKAISALGSSSRFHAVDGRAEATALPTGVAAASCCAQAFHWFANREAIGELVRITRKGGSIRLIWNMRMEDADEFSRTYESIMRRYSIDYATVNHRNLTREQIDALFSGFGIERETFRNDRDLDLETLWGRVRSSSYTPPPEHVNHGPMKREIEALFARHESGGVVCMPTETLCYRIAIA